MPIVALDITKIWEENYQEGKLFNGYFYTSNHFESSDTPLFSNLRSNWVKKLVN